MFRHFSSTTFTILILLFFSNNAFAGPVEDAEQLYKAGKYAEADKKLSPVLSKASLYRDDRFLNEGVELLIQRTEKLGAHS